MRPRFFRDRTGTTAVEFAFILPIVAAMLIGFVNGCVMYWSQTALHYACDDAARCWSVGLYCTSTGATSGTPSSGNPVTPAYFAKYHYHGFQLSKLTFTTTAAATTEGGTGGYCQAPGGSNTSTTSVPGNIVTASGTYKFEAGLISFQVPVGATACFPTFT